MLFPESRRAVELAASETPVTTPGYDVVAARDANLRAALTEEREDVADIVELDADGVACRLYRPAGSTPGGGVVVHLHGGGFVFHDVDVHDAPCRRLANRSGIAVLSIDYRRPPEHRFPAAPDDVDTVVGWLDREGGRHGLDGPTYVHGDSAGGNLALVAALRHPGRFRAVVLIYPFLDPSAGFDSYRSATDGGFVSDTAAWYWQQYAADERDLTDPDLAPLLSDRLGTLPPTLVVTSEHDVLRDEGEHLAALLAEQGVEVVATRYLGQIHGFWRHESAFPSARALMSQVVGFLQTHSIRSHGL